MRASSVRSLRRPAILFAAKLLSICFFSTSARSQPGEALLVPPQQRSQADAAEPHPTETAEPLATERRLDELERRQRQLEQQRQPVPAKSPVSVTGGPGRGFTVSLSDDRFSANVRARGQIRDTLVSGASLTNELTVRTIRLYLNGNLFVPHIRYWIQLALGGNDFDSSSSTPIFDFWVEYTRLRDLNIRIGQFFVPFDRARTVREFALQLVDRPQVVSELSLDRDIGIMLSSSNLFGSRDILSYNLGIFGGKGRNRFGGGAIGFLYVLRLSVRPLGAFDDDSEGDLLRLHRPRLMIGVAGAYNQSTDRQRSTTGSTLTLGNLDYLHGAIDTVFKFAGFSFLGEVLYRQSRTDFLDGTKDGKALREWSRSAWGYLVQAGMMLTGKLELTARWEALMPLELTDPALQTLAETQGRQLGGGLNLYLNGHLFKIQADYFYQFGGEVASGRHVARLQLDATF